MTLDVVLCAVKESLGFLTLEWPCMASSCYYNCNILREWQEILMWVIFFACCRCWVRTSERRTPCSSSSEPSSSQKMSPRSLSRKLHRCVVSRQGFFFTFQVNFVSVKKPHETPSSSTCWLLHSIQLCVANAGHPPWHLLVYTALFSIVHKSLATP